MMVGTPSQPMLVRVTWEDAACLDSESWVITTDEPTTYEPVLVTSVGFLLFQGEQGVIITGAWSPDRTGPRDQIPRGMIRSFEILEPTPISRSMKAAKR